MPTYDFKCRKCDKPWDILLSMDDYGNKNYFMCPHCGEEQDRESRTELGKGLKTITIGVSKGNYGSGGY